MEYWEFGRVYLVYWMVYSVSSVFPLKKLCRFEKIQDNAVEYELCQQKANLEVGKLTPTHADTTFPQNQ